MKICAIVVAAGRGTRAGGDIPKQYQSINGRPIIAVTVSKFADHPKIDATIAVIHPDDEHLATAAVSDMKLVHGGDSRSASVLAGLHALPGDCTHVLIHDGARPCVSHELIERVIKGLDSSDAAAPALSVTDALWRVEGKLAKSSVPRDNLARAQTPQGFRLSSILNAHKAASPGAPDDVAVALEAGIDVAVVEGEETNIKVTVATDFGRAAKILETEVDVRSGTGFDVHRFVEGNSVTLCGVMVPHSASLSGHSDADVAMHAITDAVYGALADGDIGQHFPPSDPKWKNAASTIFLEHAIGRAVERGFSISNIDCTIICEHPKIGLHAAAMQASLASICNIGVDRISVKATTTETLGFTGRGEGIAAQAAVILVKR